MEVTALNKVLITETVLRDGQQSQIATRMKTSEMVPILKKMDEVGYYALEVWGGATFDACIRFLNEDPWERLRIIKKNIKKTKLQMLLRGQNLVGYRHYSDDVVDKFIQKSIENGIDIVRIFDALNDLRNLEMSVKSIIKHGGHCQIAIAYTTSPVHTLEYYIELVKKIEKLGAHSIVIKDMAGILLPESGYRLIKAIKAVTNIPLELHTHCTSGVAEMLYLRAIDAGVDIIDTTISTFSGGSSQPATESVVYALKGAPRETDLNIEILKEVAEYFKPIRKNYLDEGNLKAQVLFTEPSILEYQLPGGMLSNLITQLIEQDSLNKYEEVLREIPRVREDMGFPPLVTPISQIIGAQAVLNVIMESRYEIVSNEIKNLVKGLYGKTLVPLKDEIIKKIIGEIKIFKGRPADLLENEFEKLKKEIENYTKRDEDILTYAMFPHAAKTFFLNKESKNKH